MQIKLANVLVADQTKAFAFYTSVLGFVVKHDVPMGGEYRWLTVVSPEGGDTELLLEPMGFEPARVYQMALFEAGIPAAMFEVADIQAEFDRLSGVGVVFRSSPSKYGETGPTLAVFEDTCGNLIQLCQS